MTIVACDNLGNFAEWVLAGAAIATAWIALAALVSWRKQLTGASKHAAAVELATSARALKYAFYGARSPLYEGSEFPKSYCQQPEPRTNDQEAEAYQWIYQNRWDFFWPYVKDFVHHIPKAAAILGEETAQAGEQLQRVARRLHFFMRRRVAQLRAGEDIVAGWADQDAEKLVQSGVETSDKTDKYSQEFEAALAKLLQHLDSHLR
jgi:hypothetical protein